MVGRIGWVAALAMTAALGGCGKPAAPSVGKGWVRLAANPATPAAAYFTITGGTEPALLTGVTGAAAQRAEMHRSMSMGPGRAGSMTGMAPLASVDVLPGAVVAFAPGERHVMLFGIDPKIKPGDRLTAGFAFADRAPITQPLKVVGPGDPAPY